MREVLYASFPDATLAEKAVGALMDHGVHEDDISLIFSEAYARTDTDGNVILEEKNPVEVAKQGITTTTSLDTAAGAVKGAGVGLGIGALAVLATLFVPGVGLVVGEGALATALASAAGTVAAGAIAGGVTGMLKDQGVSEEAAIRYNQSLSRGGALIAVSLPSGEVSQATVRQILSKYQASDFTTYRLRSL